MDEKLRAAVPDFVVEQRLRAERGETRCDLHPQVVGQSFRMTLRFGHKFSDRIRPIFMFAFGNYGKGLRASLIFF